MTNGSNTFSFATGFPVPLSSVGGTGGDLGLFFSSSPTPYNPPSPVGTPDLLVSAATNVTAFFTPKAGTKINDYKQGNLSTANGATLFTLGGSTVSFTKFNVSNTPTGSFTLSVTPTAAVPELSTMLGFGSLLAFGGLALFRQRKNARKAT